LSLTILVVVATWYGDRGLSLLPIGVLVLSLPPITGFSRLIAARRQRLEYGLLRQPLRAGLGPQLLQLANVVLLCGLLALTLPTGVYDPAALQLSPGQHRVLVVAFVLGLVAFVLLCLVPLRQVRLGSSLLVTADGTVTYVVDGHPDLPIGSVDSQHPTGNELVIDIGGGHYLLMGHLRQDSITVDVGEQVIEGQQIARVGKSGHASHPHIHIQAQTLPTGVADVTTIDGPHLLKTLHTYPLLFLGASLIRDGVETWPTAVDPRRGDVVRPIS
jgi:hypothetical protein